MALSLHDKQAIAPSDWVPICAMATFRSFWIPAAPSLGLKLIPRFGAMAINGNNKNTDQVPQLIDELAQIRRWFEAKAPADERKYLLDSVERLVVALESISKKEIIDFTIG